MRCQREGAGRGGAGRIASKGRDQARGDWCGSRIAGFHERDHAGAKSLVELAEVDRRLRQPEFGRQPAERPVPSHRPGLPERIERLMRGCLRGPEVGVRQPSGRSEVARHISTGTSEAEVAAPVAAIRQIGPVRIDRAPGDELRGDAAVGAAGRGHQGTGIDMPTQTIQHSATIAPTKHAASNHGDENGDGVGPSIGFA
jgi:hypothetical protein